MAIEEVKFDCGTGDEAFQIVVKTYDDMSDILERMKDDPDLKGKEGAGLVAAILRAVPKDVIDSVSFYKNGKLNDGPNGVAAYWRYANGRIDLIERRRDGLLNDGADGSPAMQWLYADGTLKAMRRCKDDVWNDGADGSPAYQRFYAGRIQEVMHYTDGKQSNGPRSEPSYQDFNHAGELIRAWRYKGKKRVKLSPREMRKVQKNGLVL